VSLFHTALQSASKLLSAQQWITALKADVTIIDAGLVAAKVVRATDQSIPDSALTKVIWSGVEYDLVGGSWNGANPTRLVVPDTGRYLVVANGRFAANATGARQLGVWKNNAAELQTMTQFAVTTYFASLVHVCDVITLSAGDYLEVQMAQTSGGALNAQTPFCDLSYLKVG
jgi:hypothetical protein